MIIPPTPYSQRGGQPVPTMEVGCTTEAKSPRNSRREGRGYMNPSLGEGFIYRKNFRLGRKFSWPRAGP